MYQDIISKTYQVLLAWLDAMQMVLHSCMCRFVDNHRLLEQKVIDDKEFFPRCFTEILNPTYDDNL